MTEREEVRRLVRVVCVERSMKMESSRFVPIMCVAWNTCHLLANRKALRARTGPSWVGPLSYETLKMRTPARRKSS